jgi:hypothetical protein
MINYHFNKNTMESSSRIRDSVVDEVVNKFQERSRVGIEKYGTTLDRKDLTPLDWVNHLQEELMDGILYAQRLRREISSSSSHSQDMIMIEKKDLLELMKHIRITQEEDSFSKDFFKKYLESAQ